MFTFLHSPARVYLFSFRRRRCWPGAAGPGLTIPGDSFVVHFHSDASKEDWGFKLTAVARPTPISYPDYRMLS